MMIRELDSIEIELQGITLIEAAAGTGKTHNIQNLAARMIVEKNYPLDSIVIVTFTNKAATELSDRLRSVLKLLSDFLLGKNISDPVQEDRAKKLTERFYRLGIDRDTQLERLNAALRDFDQNRVSTIHGFCERVLKENAFESSVAFRVELKKNIQQYVEKLVADFCRSERYAADPLPGADMLDINDLSRAVTVMRRRPYLELENVSELAKDREKLVKKLRDIISDIRKFPAADIVRNVPGKIKPGKESPAELADALQVLLDGEQDYLPEWGKCLCAAVPGKILENIYKSDVKAAAEYIQQNSLLFDHIDEFARIVNEDCPVMFRIAALETVRCKLQEWKQRENFHGFDDLLWEVNNALRSNELLLKTLQQKFNAGIIDEFQDTDPVQYEIFSRLFADRSAGAFFMVGDPRQAIYAFRGGDLATYLKAYQDCLEKGGKICTLLTNFRSSERMINAFNKLFEHKNLFASDQIKIEHIKSIKARDKGIYFDGKLVDYPLSVEFCPQTSTDDILLKSAYEIVHLLNSQLWQIPEDGNDFRIVRPGDIAVLAYENWQLDKVRGYLEEFNVPVIGERRSGIWGSPEAQYLADFLEAVLNNASESSVRKALLSPLCGLTLSELSNENENISEIIQDWTVLFADWDKIFHSRGIAWLMRRIFSAFELKKRLIVCIGGERSIANYVQLGDLLAGAELYNHLSPRGVLNYLNDQIAHAHVDAADDENGEMLDSDRSAVRLMTVHSSKGLQFPVVFLPALNYSYPMSKSGLKVFHRRSKLCCNPGQLTDEQHFITAEEELQELMRLVYVGVTRAVYACRIVFGATRFKTRSNSETVFCSPLDWLFGKRSAGNDEDEIREFLYGRQALTLNIPPELDQRDLFGYGKPRQYIAPEEKSSLTPPEPIETKQQQFRVLSYSALAFNCSGAAKTPSEIAGAQVGEDDWSEFRDYDEAAENEDQRDLNSERSELLHGGIWDLPSGAAVGNAWHALLENMDFEAGVDPDHIRRGMQMFGFDNPTAVDETCRMMEKLLNHQLPCGLRLKELRRSSRLNELEFEMHIADDFRIERMLQAVTPHLTQRFKRGFQASGCQHVRRGFFTGFVDMIFVHKGKFYIVDWKSNSLKRQKSAFYEPELSDCVYEATYPMQYLIYSAALLRYLEHKMGRDFDEQLFDQFFGGVYYIFLRGLMLDEPGGIFSDRPPFAAVKALAEAIRGVKDGVEND